MIGRTFGTDPEDLEIDLRAPDRPALVTRVIARCQAEGPEASTVREKDCWALPVGTRIERLLAIVAQSCGDCIEIAVPCSHPGCGAKLGLSLSASRLGSLAHEADALAIDVVLPDGRSARFRRPLGEDQRRWRNAAFSTPGEATVTMVHALAVEGREQLPDETGPWIEAVGRAMEAADPLVAFRCEVRCPECGEGQQHVVDLEGLALKLLEATQREVIGEIHHFARRYGWSEAETLAVSRKRRHRYRALLRAEEGM